MEIFNNDQELLEVLSNKQGIIFFLGQTDTGKTTFAKELINKNVDKNKKVAFLDSAVGQSTVGPPATGIGIFLDFEENNKIKIFTPIYDIKEINFLKLSFIKITKTGQRI
ncbi:MAG: hypothetical protein ISS13_00700 [Actinobacteria bacterium]|nr:hypothetical protein [Actinomycetota bacterium]MBL7060334.1 hypothetical protein [Actinomycetota bacterium]